MCSDLTRSVPIVITQQEYEKGKPLFDSYTQYLWVVTSPSEEKVTQALLSSKANVAVLGTEKYKDSLYSALKRNAEHSPFGKGKALIMRYGVGYDGIEVDRCKKEGIFLCITPGALDTSVAEHTLALMLCLARNIPYCHGEFLQGKFTRKTGFELAGKTLGLVGFGKIAQRVAHQAGAGFQMKVLAFGRTPLEEKASAEGLTPEKYLSVHGIGGYYSDFPAFARQLDLVSLHLPVTRETSPFLTAERIQQFKPGTYLINTGRGKLVDEIALYKALASGHLAGAALDVFTQEPYVPVSPDKDLRTLGNVVLTPHIASDTKESNRRMQEIILQNIEAFLRGTYKALTSVIP
ncbi:MAG: NAD(P)-dependent oxidoreductase [Spirochaetales bacterium]